MDEQHFKRRDMYIALGVVGVAIVVTLILVF